MQSTNGVGPVAAPTGPAPTSRVPVAATSRVAATSSRECRCQRVDHAWLVSSFWAVPVSLDVRILILLLPWWPTKTYTALRPIDEETGVSRQLTVARRPSHLVGPAPAVSAVCPVT